jgi:hypothetical protein
MRQKKPSKAAVALSLYILHYEVLLSFSAGFFPRPYGTFGRLVVVEAAARLLLVAMQVEIAVSFSSSAAVESADEPCHSRHRAHRGGHEKEEQFMEDGEKEEEETEAAASCPPCRGCFLSPSSTPGCCGRRSCRPTTTTI